MDLNIYFAIDKLFLFCFHRRRGDNRSATERHQTGG